MNNKKVLVSLIMVSSLTCSGHLFAFANNDDTQNPTGSVSESCSMSTTTAAAVTQANLENGVTNDTAIFGTVTTSCNSADGFKFQIKENNDACVFKHATLANSVAYTINTTTPAVSSGSGAVAALVDGCPNDTTGYVNVWSVPAGDVHYNDTLNLQTNITGAGAGQLPDGNYDETLIIRLADVAA